MQAVYSTGRWSVSDGGAASPDDLIRGLLLDPIAAGR